MKPIWKECIFIGIIVVIGLALLGQCSTPAIAGSKAASVAGAQAGSNLEINDSSRTKSKVIDRKFAPSSGNVTANPPGKMVQNPNGSDVSIRPVLDLIRFGSIFSENSLRALAKGGDVEDNFVVISDFDKPDNTLADGERYIKIMVEEPGCQTFRASSVFDAEADDNDTNSFQLIATEALKAIENGDNILIIEWEGFKDNIHSYGWGIGTHVVGSVVNDGGTISGTGGGGTGVSSNSAMTEFRPWIKGYSGSINIELPLSTRAHRLNTDTTTTTYNIGDYTNGH